MKIQFLTIIFSMLLLGQSTVFANSFANSNPPEDKISFLLVIPLLSKKYNVYFTYDLMLVDDIMVNYDGSTKTSINEELKVLLSGTDLKYKVFENNFVILYKDSREGLESLKEMMKHFKEIIKEKEAIQAADSMQVKDKSIKIDSIILHNEDRYY